MYDSKSMVPGPLEASSRSSISWAVLAVRTGRACGLSIAADNARSSLPRWVAGKGANDSDFMLGRIPYYHAT